MNKKELYKLIDSLNLLTSEYSVISGGSLLMHNLRESTNDLDIDITEKGFEMLNRNFSPILVNEEKRQYKITDDIECFIVNEIEGDKDIIDNYPCQSLISLYKLKTRLNREKDQADIKALKKILKI